MIKTQRKVEGKIIILLTGKTKKKKRLCMGY